MRLIFSLLFVTCSLATTSLAQTPLKLWYDEPAQYFEETVVLGNGKHGATVYGGANTDIIQLNDITLWSGEPVDAYMNPKAYTHVPAIREALKNENYLLADSLHRKLQGKYSNSFAPLGTLKINFGVDSGEVKNYYRELDLSNATSKVSYSIGGVKYQREYFASNPDKVIIIKLSSSERSKLSFDINFESLLRYNSSTEKKHLISKGYAPYYAAPSYFGDVPDAVLFDENRGTRFISLVTIENTDGEVVETDSTVGVKDATEAIVYISLATSFNGFDKNSAREGADYIKIAEQQLWQATQKDYSLLKADHIADYQNFFQRVSLDLGNKNVLKQPTDERLREYSKGKEDKYLEVLYFQYGRYLLISSSRTLEVPANLQGLWNPHLRPPWSSNYTMNINLEENYWLAENANLSEMHQPLLTFVSNLAETGAITAKTVYGVGGWAVAHNSDIWAMTNPVGAGTGDPVWANWNMGGAWISTHLWEHYSFTKDIKFLKDYAYPLMIGAAQFCSEWLVEDEDGYLITSPATSPENKFIADNGYHGATFYGGSADLAMVRELFIQTLDAAGVLGIDDSFTRQLEAQLLKLLPYKVGSKGNLQEWYYDWEDEDPKHRHQSHLFGLFPGYHITPKRTPDLANACRKTLEIKGDETTGWSKGWRINLWARLGDGNRAYKMYRELLQYVEPDGKRKDNSGGGTYPNLFDAHPPFQIDGNFGGAAAVIEMLLQSTNDEIFLLPALPDSWPTGEVKGICARGGFVVDMKWKNGNLIEVQITSKTEADCKLNYKDKILNVSLKAEESSKINFE